MHFKAKRVAAWAAVFASASLFGTGVANAKDDTVTLRFEHFLPANSNAQVNVIEPWCNDLKTESKGRIQCEIYPSMQLGGKPSQLNDQVRHGVVDIVWTALGYSAGSFPRSEVLELPFMLPDNGQAASKIIWDYATTYGKDDFTPYKVLAVYSDVGGTLHTTKKDVKTVDDLKGLRIRASTRLASRFLESVGATPVSMPPSQIADSLSKGVLDGALAAWEVVPPTKLDETTFYHTQTGPNQAATTITTLAVLMNKQRYEGLPADLRAILDKYSGEALTMRFAAAWDKATAQVVKTISANPKQHVNSWSADTYAALKAKSQPVVDEWLAAKVKNVDKQALYDGLEKLVKEQAPALVH
ncbi:TRAP transporter substrate-binding protein [Castellaniella caeni]|uniref:TRAP transporter substrate-binding protein n=1 Tax=Castellaniella caeni TaxID=266123 RepID=UPI0009FF2E1F|nr:TRAP transporter substrate-binding protein [Castellaniella caeni]